MSLQTINYGSAVNDGTGDPLRVAFSKIQANFSLFGLANGFATLDATGRLSAAQIPDISLVKPFVVASQAAMLALTAQPGDLAIRSDTSQTFMLAAADPTVLANWTQLLFNAPVTTVAGRTGAIVIAAADVSDATASGRSLITAANYAAMKALLSIARSDVSGLGGAAALNVGGGAGTVAAGDDSRIVGAVQSGGALGTPSSGNLLNCTFPTLNQSTTGNAATSTLAGAALVLSTPRTIAGSSFDGSANISIAYSNLTGLPALGTAAALNYGTGAGNLVRLDAATGKLPAVDGSLLTGISGAVSSVAGLSGAISAASLKTALAYTFVDIGGTLAYSSLSGLPTLGTSSSLNVGTGANQVVQLTAAGKLPAVDGSLLTGIAQPIIFLQDQKADGTAGGASVANTWTNRDLNTKVNDTAGICTLSSNQFTLPAGTYKIEAFSPFAYSAGNRLRLYNVTDGAGTLLGASGSTGNAATYYQNEYLPLTGLFTIAASKTFAIQYYCSSAYPYGLGYHDQSTLGLEYYTQAMITKIG